MCVCKSTWAVFIFTWLDSRCRAGATDRQSHQINAPRQVDGSGAAGGDVKIDILANLRTDIHADLVSPASAVVAATAPALQAHGYVDINSGASAMTRWPSCSFITTSLFRRRLHNGRIYHQARTSITESAKTGERAPVQLSFRGIQSMRNLLLPAFDFMRLWRWTVALRKPKLYVFPDAITYAYLNKALGSRFNFDFVCSNLQVITSKIRSFTWLVT